MTRINITDTWTWVQVRDYLRVNPNWRLKMIGTTLFLERDES